MADNNPYDSAETENQELTVCLPGPIYAEFSGGIIGIGTPLEVFLECDTLIAEDHDGSAGWYQRLRSTDHLVPSLVHIDRHLYAFVGRVAAVDVTQDDLDIIYFAIVDCGLPVHMPLTDINADPGTGNLGQNRPDPGAWLVGLAHLQLDWADRTEKPASFTVGGTVTAIQRLVMRTGPGFGETRDEFELTSTDLAPDQVCLTLAIHPSYQV